MRGTTDLSDAPSTELSRILPNCTIARPVRAGHQWPIRGAIGLSRTPLVYKGTTTTDSIGGDTDLSIDTTDPFGTQPTHHGHHWCQSRGISTYLGNKLASQEYQDVTYLFEAPHAIRVTVAKSGAPLAYGGITNLSEPL